MSSPFNLDDFIGDRDIEDFTAEDSFNSEVVNTTTISNSGNVTTVTTDNDTVIYDDSDDVEVEGDFVGGDQGDTSTVITEAPAPAEEGETVVEDLDGDGFSGADDPNDLDSSTPDSDGDGIDDAEDDFVDADENGIADEFEVDTDGDGNLDFADTDDDNDGILDDADEDPLVPAEPAPAPATPASATFALQDGEEVDDDSDLDDGEVETTDVDDEDEDDEVVEDDDTDEDDEVVDEDEDEDEDEDVETPAVPAFDATAFRESLLADIQDLLEERFDEVFGGLDDLLD